MTITLETEYMLCNDVHVHICKLGVLTGTHIDQDGQHVHVHVCGGTWWDV